MAKRNRMIDIHSHILPGIDDGARTFEESIEMIKWLASQGVTDVIATPHYVNETTFVSPREHNKGLLVELREKLAAQKVEVSVYLGNEIYIDREIKELVEAGRMSTMAESDYLLVELPMDREFPNYVDHLQDLMDHGYKVLLAHPERYTIIKNDYRKVEELYEMGVLLQCNLASIIGRYGTEARRVIRRLAKDKMIFAFGSDLHRCSRKDFLIAAQKKMTKYYNEREMHRLLVENPSKIII